MYPRNLICSRYTVKIVNALHKGGGDGGGGGGGDYDDDNNNNNNNNKNNNNILYNILRCFRQYGLYCDA
jgi:hypothetical protein